MTPTRIRPPDRESVDGGSAADVRLWMTATAARHRLGPLCVKTAAKHPEPVIVWGLVRKDVAHDTHDTSRATQRRAATTEDTTVGTTPSSKKDGMKHIISGSTLRTPTLRARTTRLVRRASRAAAA
jgi:hypothetical protein